MPSPTQIYAPALVPTAGLRLAAYRYDIEVIDIYLLDDPGTLLIVARRGPVIVTKLAHLKAMKYRRALNLCKKLQDKLDDNIHEEQMPF